MIAWWIVVIALLFLAYWPDPYFDRNPTTRKLARIGLFLFIAGTLALIAFPVPLGKVKG